MICDVMCSQPNFNLLLDCHECQIHVGVVHCHVGVHDAFLQAGKGCVNAGALHHLDLLLETLGHIQEPLWHFTAPLGKVELHQGVHGASPLVACMQWCGGDP